jgi:glycerol-3-phosphate acyltransferase PlsX
MERVKIALDVMGVDHGPGEIIQGAIDYFSEPTGPSEIILVGDKDTIDGELESRGGIKLPISVLHASEFIEMNEHPAHSLRKKPNASILVAMDALKSGQVQGVISAGNTGACMASALLKLGTIKGILRPSIAVLFPTSKDLIILLDGGANVEVKPEHLLQFGIMGSHFCHAVLDRENPKVGLLNVGEEEAKGSDTVKKAHKLLTSSKLNFVGNIEGADVFTGEYDVIICDGFVGNIIIKLTESISDFLTTSINEAIGDNQLAKLGATLLKPAFKSFTDQLDYAQHGGAPLLGVDGNVSICHGSSRAKAIKTTIQNTYQNIVKKVNEHIVESLANNE